MVLESVVEKFLKYPKYMTYGAGKMAKRWSCSKQDIYKAREIVRNKNKTGRLPKILIFDIETSPTIAYSFQRFNTNIYIDQVLHDPIVLTWSAKWLYGAEMMSDSITPEEVLSFNDKRIVMSLWQLLDEADIVVAHYGNGFDVPMMNYRFIVNGLLPTSPYTSIDTKKVASSGFKFPSNKLDALASYFGLPGKIKTDFSLWKGCMEGNQDSITEMLLYNEQDVYVLEEVYLKLRPYIKAHPNVGLYLESNSPVCANCGSKHLTPMTKDYYTITGRYTTFRCECGAINRQRSHNMDKEKRNVLLTSSMV